MKIYSRRLRYINGDYCTLDGNLFKGTTKMINMLANVLGKLQCAIVFITLLFPIESQWESGPQCDIRNITTGRGQGCECFDL